MKSKWFHPFIMINFGVKIMKKLNGIRTKHAIAVCKMKLFGEYDALLVRNIGEDLSDAEVYVLTWDGEASDGGDMFKLNASNLAEIINGTIFGGTS
jgi:hypothetical protein